MIVNDLLLYIGSGIIFIWGIAHIIPVRLIVVGFGLITEDNKRILVETWVTEGLTLCFIGCLVFFSTILGGSQNPVSIIVYRTSAIMLCVLAFATSMTGARTPHVAMKVCVIVKLVVAALFFLGGAL